jgi:hypothetical protein
MELKLNMKIGLINLQITNLIIVFHDLAKNARSERQYYIQFLKLQFNMFDLQNIIKPWSHIIKHF